MANVELKKDFKDGQFLYGDDLNNNFKVIEAGINANEKNLQNVIDQAQEDLKDELEEITGERGWDWNDNSGERVTFYKGDTDQVNEKPISNGQLLYDITTGETALDTGGKRVTTGAGNVLAVSDKEPTNPGTKVWIKPNELQKVDSTEVIDSLEGNETNLAPSVKAVKDTLSYSTEEQVVGTWMGKPLYRKVFTGNISKDTILISNVDTLTDVKGTGVLSGVHRVIPFYQFYNDKEYILTIEKKDTNEVVLIAYEKDNASVSYNSNITLEYTKITD